MRNNLRENVVIILIRDYDHQDDINYGNIIKYISTSLYNTYYLLSIF